MGTSPLHAVARYLLAFILAFSLCLPTAGLAYATPDEESTPPETSESNQPDSTEADDGTDSAGESTHSHDDDVVAFSTCVPSEEDIAKWEADGTLDERIAFQESLGNGEVSSSLIAQAQRRAAGSAKLRSNALDNLPDNFANDLSMSTTGEARVLALYVTFEEEVDGTVHQFGEGDTLEALQNLIGSPLPSASQQTNPNETFAPYDSLNAYYERSSYGKLDISGTAVAYTAKHPRSHYDYNVKTLFIEALAALDDQIDYANYDANGDKHIDAVYLHFAGEHSGWGSTWWSNCSFYAGDALDFDGMNLGCTITLHQPSHTEAGLRTAIHETGHALGLPDYYSYNEEFVKKDPSWRTGILTFDMMNNNLGDHNAYSKWLLGWIEESKVTRVVANDKGITVRENGVVRKISSGESSFTQTLGLLATNSLQECGGFIAISNDESLLGAQGLFTSFYLMEYNGPYGNQMVRYRAGYENSQDVSEAIPSGFRLFRIQAELDEDGFAFARSNRSDDVHNQLIELVDHDAATHHTEFADLADGTGWAPYGCMMAEGDAIGPEGVSSTEDGNVGHTASYPSTNFYEKLTMGFTGLTMRVVESNSMQGAVSISYSGEAKPDLSPDALSLSLAESHGVSNIDVVELESSLPVMRGEYGMVYIKAKETCAVATVEDVNGTSITLSYTMPPELFVPGESCEVVFPARCFFIGNKDGESVYSEELRVELPIGNTVGFDEVGDYTNAVSNTCVMSNVVTAANGTTYFAIQDKGQISLCSVDPDEPTKTQVSATQGVDSTGAYRLQLEPFSNGGLCLIATSYLSGRGAISEAYWLDPATAAASTYVNLSLGDISTISTYDNTLVTTRFTPADHYYNTPSYLEIEAYDPAGNSDYATGIWTVESLESVHEVSNDYGKIALVGRAYSEDAGLAKIVDLAKLIDGSTSGQVIDFSEVDAEATLNASSYSGISAFARHENGYLALTYDMPEAVGSPDTANPGAAEAGAADSSIPAWRGKTDLKAYLVSFGSSGVVSSSYLFGTFPMHGASLDSLAISPQGVPAAEITLDPNGMSHRRVLFFRDSVTSAPITLCNESGTSGTWLENDTWLEANFNFPRSYFFGEDDLADNDDGAVGSPDLAAGTTNVTEPDESIGEGGEGIEGGGNEGGLEGGLGDGFEGEIGSGYEQESRPVHYLVAFMPDNSNDGGEGGAGDSDEGNGNGADNGAGGEVIPGSGSSANGGSSLSKTGDGTGLAAVAFGSIAAAAGVLALLAFVFSRKSRRR